MGLGSASVDAAGGDSYEKFNDDGIPYVKLAPSVSVGGTAKALRYFTGSEDEGGFSRGYIGVVLEDPYMLDLPEDVTDNEGGTEDQTLIVSDTTIEAQDEGYSTARDFVRAGGSGASTDGKVVNPSDRHTDLLEGVGVEIGGFGSPSLFKGQQGDFTDIESDEIVLIISGATASRVARVLDVKGATSADMAPPNSDSLTNGGLMEYAPEGAEPDEHGSTRPRYARNPELRDDLEGEEIAILLQRREEVDEDYAEEVAAGNARGMYWTTIIDVPEDGLPSEDDLVQPTSEFEPSPGNTTWLVWNYEERGSQHSLTNEEEASLDAMIDNIEDNGNTVEELEDDELRSIVADNSDHFRGDTDEIVSAIRQRA